MKKFLLLKVLFFFALSGSAQDWAPIGAAWYYSEGFSFWNEYDEDYIKFESVKDTLVEGKNCRKITKLHKIVCNDRPSIEYMYSENGKVFSMILSSMNFKCYMIFLQNNLIHGQLW